MKHRADIDGLRAVAIVPVILFHAGFNLFSGGFVGVDTFFVISGYLITSIIIDGLAQETFSIVNFYERRARRILPALFVVMACCVPVAWLWMVPDEFRQFGRSLVAVVGFASNILFWRETGYFAQAADETPLLNTWSLAVEEQFYVLFPLLLVLVWRFGRRRTFQVLALIALASFLISEWGARHRPGAAFYLIPSRAWELLAGAMCALLLPRAEVRPSDPLAAFGLGLILFAVFRYDANTPSPGLYTAVPVLGTVLVIVFAAPETAVGKLLSNKAVVGLGLISYSAYLWHYPVFAFARIHSSHGPGPWLLLAYTAGVIVLAALTWRFVEQPVRLRTAPPFATRRGLFAGAAAAAVMLAAAGYTAEALVPPYVQMAHPDLFRKDRVPVAVGEPCRDFSPQGGGDASCMRYGHGPHRTVVWGDSHALSLRDGLSADAALSVFVLAHSSCPPILDVVRYAERGATSNCPSYDATRHYAEFIRALGPEQVFLIGRWMLYLRGWIRNGDLSTDHLLTDRVGDVVDASSSQRVFVAHMSRTIEYLATFSKVAVVQQAPELGLFGKQERLFSVAVPRRTIEQWHEPETAAFREIADEAAFALVRSRDVLCSATECRLRDDGLPLYFDDNHLSRLGASKQWELMTADIDALHCRGKQDCGEKPVACPPSADEEHPQAGRTGLCPSGRCPYACVSCVEQFGLGQDGPPSQGIP